jgi:hypothetical protein
MISFFECSCISVAIYSYMCRQSCKVNPNSIFLLAEVSNKVQLITLDRPASLDSLLEMPNLLGYA